MAISFQERLAIQQGEIVDNLIDNLVKKFNCLLIIVKRDKKINEIMGKLEKLIDKLLRDPPELSYNDVHYILTNFGFQEVSSKGSHHTFRNNEEK